jgi:hypothetical protein
LPSFVARYATSAVDSPGRYPTARNPSATAWTEAGASDELDIVRAMIGVRFVSGRIVG